MKLEQIPKKSYLVESSMSLEYYNLLLIFLTPKTPYFRPLRSTSKNFEVSINPSIASDACSEYSQTTGRESGKKQCR
jgi:hypothetical protein